MDWTITIGYFLFIAGFVIGLGAVTVIDVHGFLARKNTYWTQTTIRAHKVTKPLIWLGMILAIIGGMIVYMETGFSIFAKWHLFIAIVLILNGVFLSFKISPELLNLEKENKDTQLLQQSMQNKIAVGFVVSFLGWWGAVFIFALHISSMINI